MAMLLGIDVDRTISLTFLMGAALAAVAGAFDDFQLGRHSRIQQSLMQTCALFERHAGILIAAHDQGAVTRLR